MWYNKNVLAEIYCNMFQVFPSDQSYRCSVVQLIKVENFLKLFEQEMVNSGQLSKGSAKSYLSYLRSFENYLLKKEKIRGGLKSNSGVQRSGDCMYLSGLIAREILAGEEKILRHLQSLLDDCIVPRKDVSNWKSAYIRFSSFIFENISKEELTQIAVHESNFRYQSLTDDLKISDYVDYTLKDIKAKFVARCNTWDRYYPASKMYYPSRILQILFQNDLLHEVAGTLGKGRGNYYSRYYIADMDSWKVYVRENESGEIIRNLTLSEVNTLRLFADGKKCVQIILNSGEKYDLLSPSSGDSFVPMIATVFRDISIDHINPMRNILDFANEKFSNVRFSRFENLSKIIFGLSLEFNISEKNYNELKKAFASKLELGEISFTNDEILELFKEFQQIVACANGHQLMLRSANSSKGAKVL